MYDKFQFNRSNSSSFIKKNKKQHTIFHLPKLSNKYIKRKFRLQKGNFFYISISSWISIHPNDFIQSIWHGIDQLLCDICAKPEVKIVSVLFRSSASLFSFFFPSRPTYARWDSNPEKMTAI